MDLVQSLVDGKTEVSREDIRQITGMIRDLYRDKNNVEEIPTRNVIFVGDLHGEYDCALGVRDLFKKYKNHTFVFLGDYADRGPAQIETINLVMALALLEPERVLMLRGNHESDDTAQKYGFYSEVTRVHSFDVYGYYLDVFQVLPLAAMGEGIFACHGGIPEGVKSLDDIQTRNRFNLNFPDDVLFQLAWNDPKEADFRFAANSRGQRVKAFGRKAFDEFSDKFGIEKFIRAHEVAPDGIRTFFDDRLISVFSASSHGRANPKVVRLGSKFTIEPIDLQI
ncbi:MAG: metallophosphoesterase [Candidatus Thorarchaeota archaeon]|jgi:predicted phosphodiesterase